MFGIRFLTKKKKNWNFLDFFYNNIFENIKNILNFFYIVHTHYLYGNK